MTCPHCKGTGLTSDATKYRKLKALRRHHDFTLKRASEKSGVRPNTIFAIENGIINKTATKYLEALCKAYDFNVEEL